MSNPLVLFSEVGVNSDVPLVVYLLYSYVAHMFPKLILTASRAAQKNKKDDLKKSLIFLVEIDWIKKFIQKAKMINKK